ncbi:MAG TPA: hypothetical protein VLT59_13605 [Steroidobacteraceae bacterium]|nr:hypothetical protein [Steroidobacteraceae bacterium]
MSFAKWDDHAINTPSFALTEGTDDRRAAVARHAAEELDRRRQELLQLRSSAVSLSSRIRLWETRYGLALPRDPGHPLLAFIADVTGSTIDDLRSEQRERASTHR